jgi:lipopolysaccharide transport system permease protein
VTTTRDVERPTGADLRPSRTVRFRRHVRELFSSRELLFNLTLRELRSRYKRSVLGWSWSLINPLSNVVIYSIVFAVILKVKPPLGVPSGLKSFPLFLLCGLIPWLFFSNGLMLTTESLLSNGNLIKKVYFPRELLVAAGVGSLVITNLIEMAVLCSVLLLFGNMVIWWIPILLVLIFLESVMILGIGLMLSALNVFFRDFRYLITIMLNFLFYLIPIVYPVSYVPIHANILGRNVQVRRIYELNPLTRLVGAYRNVLYDNRFPTLGSWEIIILTAVFCLVVGWSIFGRLQRRVAEEV